jgi:hypothetical protein
MARYARLPAQVKCGNDLAQNGTDSLKMHYLFLDESYPASAPGQKTIVMATWTVDQSRWRDSTVRNLNLFNPPVLERICAMLKSLDTTAAVTTSTLDETIFRAGVVDSTNDIPEMKRPDAIWTICAAFAIATSLFERLSQSRELGTVDIHFDPKSLKSAHFESTKQALRHQIVGLARKFPSKFDLRKLKIRRIESVPKPKSKEIPNKFQIGTWVADKLCADYKETEALKCSRILTRDLSESVRRTTQQLDGKSYYAGN